MYSFKKDIIMFTSKSIILTIKVLLVHLQMVNKYSLRLNKLMVNMQATNGI